MTAPVAARPSAAGFGAARLCSREALLATVLLGQLLAILLTLAESTGLRGLLNALALNSLFVLWVTLASTALVCVLQRRLQTLGPACSLSLAYAGILLVAWALSELAWQLAAPALSITNDNGAERQHFLVRNLGLTGIIAAISLRYVYLQHIWQERLLSETSARIAALQARIRPHFLFNSLNSIAALIASEPKAAEQAILDLSEIFRASLQNHEVRVPLDEELTVCEHYLAIEALRLGERLKVHWDVNPAARAVAVPSLILQPLVENAVYHGIEPLTQGGTIRIGADCDQDQLLLSVVNPRPTSAPAQGRRHQGMALANIRERLLTHYGARAGARIAEAPGVFSVTLSMPKSAGTEHAHIDCR